MGALKNTERLSELMAEMLLGSTHKERKHRDKNLGMIWEYLFHQTSPMLKQIA